VGRGAEQEVAVQAIAAFFGSVGQQIALGRTEIFGSEYAPIREHGVALADMNYSSSVATTKRSGWVDTVRPSPTSSAGSNFGPSSPCQAAIASG
jgi:hypothetical protein